MSSHRINRIEEDMKRSISEIIRGLKDPRISPLISVVKVEVSGDLSYAKVYVSAIEGYEKSVESAKGLKSAAGYIRRQLSAASKLRKLPELTFIADNSIAYGAHIAKIIEDFAPSEADPLKESSDED